MYIRNPFLQTLMLDYFQTFYLFTFLPFASRIKIIRKCFFLSSTLEFGENVPDMLYTITDNCHMSMLYIQIRQITSGDNVMIFRVDEFC